MLAGKKDRAMNDREIKDLLLKSTVIRRMVTRIKEAYRHRRTDCYIISYPKCGRTWLRTMLAKALAIYYDDPRSVVWDPRDVIETVRQHGPFIQFTHAGVDSPPQIPTERPETTYYQYRKKRVIFLVRDPRDVLVSYFFQKTRREGEPFTLSDFVRHPWWGADRLISYMRGWYRHRHIPLDFLCLRYEDMHHDAAAELRRVLAFVGLDPVFDQLIRSSVEYARFDNMRNMSLNELVDNLRLAPADPRDAESYKVRRGKIAGYVDYLSAADVEYIEDRMRRDLPCEIGYTPCKA